MSEHPEITEQIRELAKGIKGLLEGLTADPGTRIDYEASKLMETCREILGENEKGQG